MTDLITLSCPSCGAKLKISPHATSYICDYCGNEYLIKKEGNIYNLQEDFARCPVCHRNDKVQKLSSIVASQTQLLEGTAITTDAYRDDEGTLRSAERQAFFTGKQASTLARQLVPPAEPVMPNHSRSGMLTILFVALLIYSTVFLCPGCLFSTALIQAVPTAEGEATPVAEAIAQTAGGLFWLAIGSVFLFLLIKSLSFNDKEKKKRREAAYQQKKMHWDAAIQKYNRSYYCFRDGIIFDPESSQTGKPAALEDFLDLSPEPTGQNKS